MADRVLEIAVCGPAPAVHDTTRLLRETTAQQLATSDDAPTVHTRAIEDEPTHEIAATHHLVLSQSPNHSNWSDLAISSNTEVELLARERLAPWATRWQQNRRAPRAQIAVLARPDPNWPHAADRLIARLHTHLTGRRVIRIDHIGSTSVPELPAKNLIDIQVTVADLSDTRSVASAATAAGFVHVAGQWSGKDRDGRQHPEEVCVDADPGRPVNVNIRPATAPVARDALLFRDWLRAKPTARDCYLEMKSQSVGLHVDQYGASKEPFISAALKEAERWAATAGWTV